MALQEKGHINFEAEIKNIEALNFYDRLGIERQGPDEPERAFIARLKTAFHQKAKEYHPDSNGNNSAYTRLFQLINEAHNTLSHRSSRELYDANLAESRRFSFDEYSNEIFQSNSFFDVVTILSSYEDGTLIEGVAKTEAIAIVNAVHDFLSQFDVTQADLELQKLSSADRLLAALIRKFRATTIAIEGFKTADNIDKLRSSLSTLQIHLVEVSHLDDLNIDLGYQLRVLDDIIIGLSKPAGVTNAILNLAENLTNWQDLDLRVYYLLKQKLAIQNLTRTFKLVVNDPKKPGFAERFQKFEAEQSSNKD